MEVVDVVSGVLAHSSRSEERTALWIELATMFEKTGASAATQGLAERADGLKTKFDSTLREIGKKL
jgi:hypothetical protein